MGVGVWERRVAKTAKSGGVWWGTPEVNGASSPPLLYAERTSPRETGLFPVHACWCTRSPGRERRGTSMSPETWAAGPEVWTKLHPWYDRRARLPVRPGPSSAAGQEVDEAAGEAAAPRAPDHRGERVWLLDSAPYLDPSFQNTALPSQTPQHDEDTRSPVYFGHFIPFGHFIFIISVE